jgi:LDH2 family malate/lactate/ureidoglycolate dehydrogenase
MPGERGRQKKARYAKDGIPLDAAIWQNTLRIAGELGVAAPQL